MAAASASGIVLESTTPRGRALSPLLVYVGLLVAMVSSLGAPLVPTIAADYEVSLGSAQWSLTVTLLVGALSTPVIGRLGDGPRRLPTLLGVLLVVVVGSVLAAMPGPFALVLVGRGCQGVSLALVPLAMSVAQDHLPAERARATLAMLSVTVVVGAGLGFPVTGLIAQQFGFRAAFWMCGGLALVALLAVAAVVPASTDRVRRPFDSVGAGLLGLGLGGVVLAPSEASRWGWASSRLGTVGGCSLALLALGVRHQLRTPHPLVNLRLLRHRTVLTANVTGLLAGVVPYILISMVIRFVQTPTTVGYGLGASIVVSGLVLLPMSMTSFLASRLVSYLGRWVEAMRFLPVGALLFTVTLAVFATSRSQLWQLFVVMGIAGLGLGCSFAVLPRLIVTAVPAGATSSALAMHQVVRTVGFALGSAVSANILTAHTVAPAVLPDNSGYTAGAVVAVALCLITAAAGALLQRHRPVVRARGPGGEQELLADEGVDAPVAGVSAYQADDPSRATSPSRPGQSP